MTATPTPTDLPEALRLATARAIWAVMREHEDRCDMELEDMGEHCRAWALADAALNASASVAPPVIDFSLPLETYAGEPVKYVCHDVIEHKCARVCVDAMTGRVYSSPYIGLMIRNRAAPTAPQEGAPAEHEFLINAARRGGTLVAKGQPVEAQPQAGAESYPPSDEELLRVIVNACDSLHITRFHEIGGKTSTIAEDAGLLEIGRAVLALHDRSARGSCCSERNRRRS